MARIEWAMWANEQAVVSGVCLLMGSIIGVAGAFKNWEFSAFAIIVSVFVLVLEWPRGKRQKGKTLERKFQIHLAKLLNMMVPVSSNYYARFIIHIILSIPCCFLLPTIMGGMSLMMAAVIYLVGTIQIAIVFLIIKQAAIKGEEWQPVGLEKKVGEQVVTDVSRPTRPPPRSPRPAERHIQDNAV
ncbi:hypothetical protein LSH36_35g06057 [Paralvinella palmiformis]|uniref:Cytochrome b-245 light chain n=1 Tax=Paralvinella palmiformis TaxID=53620 RepID=A0AAD9K8T5_9ANNE|nr:hypothetical protein LSH36_35g06057 [Paralvinella palmiformis]